MKLKDLRFDSDLLGYVRGCAKDLNLSEFKMLEEILYEFFIRDRSKTLTSKLLAIAVHQEYRTKEEAQQVAERFETGIAETHLDHAHDPKIPNDIGMVDIEPFTPDPEFVRGEIGWFLGVRELRDGKWKIKMPGLEEST